MIARRERRRSPRPGRHLPPWQVDLGGVRVEHASLWVAVLFCVLTLIGERRMARRAGA